MTLPRECDVAVVGAGPAGLSAATGLARRGVREVVVVERDTAAGGVPRHCGHYPFGWREYRRLHKGPAYARALVAEARAAGAAIHCGVTVVSVNKEEGAGAMLTLSTPDC